MNVKINDLHCVVPDNLTLSSNTWAYTTANCSMPLVTAGRYNVSIDVQDSNTGFGIAQPGNFLSIGTGIDSIREN